nr:hypothetical protein Iba_chr14eCG7940 [Ipomoea batatas]
MGQIPIQSDHKCQFNFNLPIKTSIISGSSNPHQLKLVQQLATATDVAPECHNPVQPVIHKRGCIRRCPFLGASDYPHRILHSNAVLECRVSRVIQTLIFMFPALPTIDEHIWVACFVGIPARGHHARRDSFPARAIGEDEIYPFLQIDVQAYQDELHPRELIFFTSLAAKMSILIRDDDSETLLSLWVLFSWERFLHIALNLLRSSITLFLSLSSAVNPPPCFLPTFLEFPPILLVVRCRFRDMGIYRVSGDMCRFRGIAAHNFLSKCLSAMGQQRRSALRQLDRPGQTWAVPASIALRVP